MWNSRKILDSIIHVQELPKGAIASYDVDLLFEDEIDYEDFKDKIKDRIEKKEKK